VNIATLRPGQLLWTALDRSTRGDSPVRRFVPVIVSLVTDEDVQELENGARPSVIAEKVVARIMRETYEQGGLLSTRDVALLLQRNIATVSVMRSRYEKAHQTTLPHTGTLHDMGSCISHKRMILTKIILEKKDPTVAARESHHTQAAVDRYLRDYYRVRTVYEHNPDDGYIHHVTGIARHVVREYIDIIVREREQE
jgi:hypothetical protein